MTALERNAVEFSLPSGSIIRGLELAGAGKPSVSGRGTVVFVHDIGADIDEFGALPQAIARLGFDVVLVDLPGHGLSDGDEPDPGGIIDAVTAVLDELADRAPFGLVSAGRSATAAASLGRPHEVVTQLLINPVLDDAVAADTRRTHSVRMVLHGDGPEFVGTETQRFFSYLIGEKMLIFNSSIAAGPSEVTNLPTVRTHVELFFQRYLNRQS
jgi:pimeloyl-ACP methyl ester carboxylesterase